MAELGSDARSYHQEVGEYAKEQGINVLLTLGVLSQNTSDAFAHKNEAISEHFSDKQVLNDYLFNLLVNQKNTAATMSQEQHILVKGSRSAHMEYVVEDLINWHTQQQQESQLLNSNEVSKNKQDTA